MKIIMLVFMFFCIGAFFIISQNNLSLGNPENLENFISFYKNWVENSFENVGRLTGHIVNMEWLPE